ncbi:MAG: cytochrome C, partial [Nitrospirota bacterium]
QGTDNGLFCLNCHPSTNQNVVHTEHVGRSNDHCTNCHIRVPHGGKVSRLIATTNMPARYYPNGDGTGTMQMTRFVKTSRNNYQWGSQNCGATACRGSHNNTTGEQW